MFSVLIVLSCAALPMLCKILTLAFVSGGYLLQSSYKILQLLIPIAFRGAQGRRGLSLFWPIEEPRPSGKVLLLALFSACVLALTGILALSLIASAIGIHPDVIRAGFDARFRVGPAGAVGIVLFLATLNAAIEELHFRSWLDGELSSSMGNKAGISISAGAFGLMHVFILTGLPDIPSIALILMVLALVIAGGWWSILRRQKGGIHAAFLSHAFTNVLLLGWGLKWLGYV